MDPTVDGRNPAPPGQSTGKHRISSIKSMDPKGILMTIPQSFPPRQDP